MTILFWPQGNPDHGDALPFVIILRYQTINYLADDGRTGRRRYDFTWISTFGSGGLCLQPFRTQFLLLHSPFSIQNRNQQAAGRLPNNNWTTKKHSQTTVTMKNNKTMPFPSLLTGQFPNQFRAVSTFTTRGREVQNIFAKVIKRKHTHQHIDKPVAESRP